MHIKIKKSVLADCLKIVNGAISSKPSIPVLTAIKFEVSNGNLILTASDGSFTIKTKSEDFETIKDGAVLVESKVITDAVSKSNGEMELIVTDKKFTIKNKRAKFKINKLDLDLYPQIAFNSMGNKLLIDSDVFTHAVNRVINSVSTQENRPVLTGVNLKALNNKLTFIATDSFRVSKTTIDIDSDMEFNIVIPDKTIKEIVKNATGTLKVSTNEKQLLIEIEDVIFLTNLIDAAYPNIDNVIPTEFNTTVTVDRSNLINSVNRSSFIKDSNNIWLLKLTIEDEKMAIEASTEEVVSSFEEMPITLSGNKMIISLNGNFLLNALRSLEDDNVDIMLNGDNQPLIVNDTTNQTQLILPVRTA